LKKYKIARELKEISDIYNLSHLPSAISAYPIWLDILCSKKYQNKKIFLGKPFGFYTFLYICNKVKILTDNEFQEVMNLLLFAGFDGVINTNQLNYLKSKLKGKINYKLFLKELKRIKYIDSTMGSVYSVARQYSLLKNKEVIVFIPDSVLIMGEFYESLVQEKINLSKINLLIDFNTSTKQNKLPLSYKDINYIFSIFNINANIYYNKELKEIGDII